MHRFHMYVTGIKIGLWNLQDSSCIVVEEDGLGMPADVQADWQDSTAHVHRIFPP